MLKVAAVVFVVGLVGCLALFGLAVLLVYSRATHAVDQYETMRQQAHKR